MTTPSLNGGDPSPYANIRIPRLPVPPAGSPAPATPGPALAGVPAPRGPIVRGQSEDEPLPPLPLATAPPPPRLPSPAALGLALPPSSALARAGGEMDWTATRGRLKELGVVSFRVNEVPQGGWRFVCEMRTAQAGVLHRIETGPVATEAEAVTLALAEAGRWKGNR